MTTEEMLQDFSQQKDEIVEEIRSLELEIVKKKEQFFRLQGAVEALTLAVNTGKGACLDDDCEDDGKSVDQIIEELDPSKVDNGIADPSYE